MVIPSTGAFSATLFSSSKVFAFLATNVELFEIKTRSIKGSLGSSDNSSAIRCVITEL